MECGDLKMTEVHEIHTTIGIQSTYSHLVCYYLGISCLLLAGTVSITGNGPERKVRRQLGGNQDR